MAAIWCIVLSSAILFALPRDATLLATASAALHLPFGSGPLVRHRYLFRDRSQTDRVSFPRDPTWVQGTAEVAALLATFAALGSTLKLRYEAGAEWHAIWWSDQYVMFFAAAAVLYAAVAPIVRQRPSHQYAAALAVLGSPVPFLVRASLPPICTLYSKAPPTLPSVLAAFTVALGTGVSLAAFAIFARTRLADSNARLQREPR